MYTSPILSYPSPVSLSQSCSPPAAPSAVKPRVIQPAVAIKDSGHIAPALVVVLVDRTAEGALDQSNLVAVAVDMMGRTRPESVLE